jgi:hypothetical protein
VNVPSSAGAVIFEALIRCPSQTPQSRILYACFDGSGTNFHALKPGEFISMAIRGGLKQMKVKANGAGVLLPVGDGSAASDRQIDQTLMYDGSQASPVYSIVYSVRRMLSEVQALLSARGISGVPIRADRTGAASVDTALNAALAPMARVGHFLPGRAGTAPNDRALPNGYDVVTTPSGTELLSRVTQLYGPEATAIAITDDGIVVVEA